MNAKSNAVRAGLSRGWIEFKQTFTNGQDISNYLIFPVISIIVMVLMRNSTAPGSDVSLGLLLLPSAIGLNVVVSGMMGATASLTVGREDGTLLRAKAMPNGVLGYLIGVLVYLAGVTVVSIVMILVPGLLLIDGLAGGSAGTWLALIAIVVFGCSRRCHSARSSSPWVTTQATSVCSSCR